MCGIPAAMLAITALSAVGQVVAQKQQADAQAASNQRQYENTMQAYRENVNQTNLMQQQERENALQATEANGIKARAAESTATVAAGENGISGLSVDALLADINNKQGRYDTSVQTNFDRAQSAIQSQRNNVYSNAATTINSLQTPATPDYLGAGLKIGTGVYNYGKATGAKWAS